ncbi:MAG: molybdenum ABC transporter ATP-binding protein [Gammaproteobacteria bacterium]|nr:molybdenum ABC transporter ATP-binding protein [Gammaproteobacteria bacterium]
MSEQTPTMLSVGAKLSYPGFSLDVELEEKLCGIVGLFGPSGSGKSTLLRIIAGLEKNSTAEVGFGDERWQSTVSDIFVPPHQRPVGYVFQHARLFPHLTVAGNLEYAHRRGSRSGDSEATSEVIAAMNLESLLPRDVDALSGGELQRVSLARTLMSGPRLLLLDEPLGALDVRAKNDILPYLENLPARFGIPAIFVSHSVNEMARLADKVIALDNGRVEAVGSAAEILSGESLRTMSLPFEPVTILDVTVAGHMRELHLTRVMYGDQQLTVPELHRAAEGDTARLSVRAGDVVLATVKPEGLSVRNILRGRVSEVSGLPDTAFALVSVDVDGALLKARVTHQAVSELRLQAGTPVYALIKTAIFDRGV